MKKEIDTQEYAKFQKDCTIFTILFIALLISPIPLAEFLGWTGVAVYLFIFAISMYYAFQVEKSKKKFDIQTYKEIVAFTEGKALDDIEKAREEGKRPYQKVLLAIGSGLLSLLIALLIGAIIKAFS